MKRRHWLWMALCIVFLFIIGTKVSQVYTEVINEPLILGNYLEIVEGGTPTTTIIVDEAGMWIAFMSDPQGAKIHGGDFHQNIISGDIWWSESYNLVRWSATEGMFVIPNDYFGYPDERLSPMGTDREGNIWVGYNSETDPWATRPQGGVLRLALDGIVYDYSDKVEALNYIEADRTGNRWFFERDYITHFDGESWVNVTGSYITQFYPEILYTLEHGGRNKWYVESPDRVWYISYGPNVYDGTEWISFTESDGLLDDAIYDMIVDHQGHKWFNTSKGVCELDDKGTAAKYDDVWTNHPVEGGDFAVDHDGKVWVSNFLVEDTGVWVWDGHLWTEYNSRNSGLTDDEVYTIFVDDTGAIWFSTFDGVVRLIQDFNRVYMPFVSMTQDSE